MAISAANLILCNAVYEDPVSHNITLLGIFTAMRATKFPTAYRNLSIYAVLKGIPGHTGEVTVSCRSVQSEVECARERQRIQIGELGMRHLHIRLGEIRFPEAGEYQFSLAFDGAVVAENELFVMKVE